MTVGQIEASELVAALEVVWAVIQDRHVDVPDVVVTLGAGSVGVPRGSLKLGHFAADRWASGAGSSSSAVAELFVGGEGLSRGAQSVLATLLHEAAHGGAHVRRVKDTSRDGRYHSARYRALVQEMRLAVTQPPGIGWSGTGLGPGTAVVYAAELDGLAAAITAYRHAEGYLSGTADGDGAGDGADGAGDGNGAGGLGKRSANGVVLACSCPRKVRCSTAVAEAGPIVCGVCQAAFQ